MTSRRCSHPSRTASSTRCSAATAFGRDVAALITRLTTIDGHLQEGAPTSGHLANLVLTNALDRALQPMLLSKCGLKVHRTRRPVSPGNDAQPARKPSKLKIADRCEPQLITGLLANCTDRLTLPRRERAKMRAAIHQLRAMDSDSALVSATSSVRGRIARIRTLHPQEAQRLEAHLDTCAKRA
jgi:hypothetical protein